MQPGIIPLRPLTLGEILDGSFRAIRTNPGVMFGLSAAVVVVTVALSTLVGYYVVAVLQSTWPDFLGDLDPTATSGVVSSFSSSAGSVISALVMLFVQPILTGLLIVSVSRSVLGKKVSLSEVWNLTRGRKLRLLGFSLALSLVGLLAMAVVVGLVVLLAVNNQDVAAVATGILGAALLAVGGVWVSTRTLLVAPTMALEGTSFRQAVTRGWKLTYGSFWRLFGIYLLVTVMMSIISSLLQTPVGLVSGFMLTNPDLQIVGVVLNAVSLALTETVTLAYTGAVIALLYVDVRIRREGLDVELARAAGEVV